MRYKILGDNLPAVTIQFDQGESIYTQSGGMTWMSDNFNMETNMRGGLGKSLGRMFTGESLFMVTYTALAPNAEMTLASSFPGEIKPIQLDGSMEYIAQKSAFLCATPGVELTPTLPVPARVSSVAKASSCNACMVMVSLSLNSTVTSLNATCNPVNDSK